MSDVRDHQESYSDLDVLRHSTTHVMAKAVQRLFPGSRLAIGPPIENGFYYDIEVSRPLSIEDLPAIEAEMQHIIAADEAFTRTERSREEALAFERGRDAVYKVEILEGIADPTVSYYATGDDWIDLCRGPHVARSSDIKAFKLTSVAGAYWRGDEQRPMLQRIYGTSWFTQEELDHYLWTIEEARRRDHRRLGRELELFFFDEVAPGQPFWLPNGMVVMQQLEELLRTELRQRGYVEISTPGLVKSSLWEQSGHWAFYQENMFRAEVEGEQYAWKPMNCPESTLVYRFKTRSYRDLPLRLAQTDRLLRNERSGTLNGLLRVRQLTMDDAHVYVRPDQIQAEIAAMLEFGKFMYDLFGFERRYYLSTKPEKALGTQELWDEAEGALSRALESVDLPFEIKDGDGAFYGPKIDIDIHDALGRPWQLTTIQLDYQTPERFDLEYVGEDGQRHRPAIIHRAIYGTYERFMAILIEHFAGAFPLWLAPVQAVLIPIADRHAEYAEGVATRLRAAGMRVEVDARRERMQARIRDAQLQKVPYMLVMGDRDILADAVAVRERQQGDLGSLSVETFIDMIRERLTQRE